MFNMYISIIYVFKLFLWFLKVDQYSLVKLFSQLIVYFFINAFLLSKNYSTFVVPIFSLKK